MAKELPYFKFEPAEWESGNIQAVSRESKGLFIEICSLYWLRLGELPYALALQKLCNGNAEQLTELCKLEILGVEDSQIVIEFLDEQLNEFQKTSEKRAKAANKRWKDAKGMQLHKHSNAIREDEIREDEIREDDLGSKPPKFNFKKSLEKKGVKEPHLSDWLEVRKKKKSTNSETALNGVIKQAEKAGITLDQAVLTAAENSWAGFNAEWYSNKNQNKPKQSRSEYINQELNKHFGNNEPEPEQTHDIDYTEVNIDDFKGL